MNKIAIIGGTGVYSPNLFSSSENKTVETPFGSVSLIKANYEANEIYFLERHGSGHKKPPHAVNYRANISALKQLKVDRIFATAAVGSMNIEMSPGSFVIVNQFLDFTKNRPSTFFDGENGVVHVDMTEPYCPEIRNTFKTLCSELKLKYFDKATYVCTEGPRFENPAEIKMFKILGGDIVGMTNYPEVVLAREANLCYAVIGLVTNYAAGISTNPLTHKEVIDNLEAMSNNINTLFLKAITSIPVTRSCVCNNATSELGSLK